MRDEACSAGANVTAIYAYNSCADAEHKGADECRMRILGQFTAHFFGATGTSHRSVQPVVDPSDRLVTVLAVIASRRSNILGRAELRGGIIEATVGHGAER